MLQVGANSLVSDYFMNISLENEADEKLCWLCPKLGRDT